MPTRLIAAGPACESRPTNLRRRLRQSGRRVSAGVLGSRAAEATKPAVRPESRVSGEGLSTTGVGCGPKLEERLERL